ncbi:MAG: NAD(P)H-binding protein, partial [Myxococcota bacterium]
SCLGHVAHQPVMDTATQHILAAAKAQPVPPRCVLISSIGMGGTSWPIRMLLRAKLGKACLDDYQAADALVRTASDVRCVLVRPFALTDKPGKGVYAATESTSALFASSIARADVARFMLDAVTDRQWDGKPGIQLSGAPSPSPST